jgi:hypothetical protein
MCLMGRKEQSFFTQNDAIQITWSYIRMVWVMSDVVVKNDCE